MSPQNWNFQFRFLVPNHVIGSLPLRELAWSIVSSGDTLVRQLVIHTEATEAIDFAISSCDVLSYMRQTKNQMLIQTNEPHIIELQ